jgi:hypothetical protein
MQISVIDIDTLDSKRRFVFPNLALMKLSAWHKMHGDTILLNSFDANKAYISSVFSWRKSQALAAYSALQNKMEVEMGGSGIDIYKVLPDEIENIKPDYTLYDIDYGLGFLQRGCIRKCPFCLVPKKEGKPVVVACISKLLNPRSNKLVLLDNNFLSLGNWTLDTLKELADRQIKVSFSQGLDIRLVTPEIAGLLAQTDFYNTKFSYKQLTFAFDHIGIERKFRAGVDMLTSAGIKPYKLQSFILVGFNSSFEEDFARFKIITELGIDPFVMLYRDTETGQETPDAKLRHFRRWVNARIWKTCVWEDYRPWRKNKRKYRSQVAMNF